MKQRCEYCKGITHDDTRGNCLACGAPREVYLATPDLYTPYPHEEPIRYEISTYPTTGTWTWYGGYSSTNTDTNVLVNMV